jgi:hypothetical protein
VTLIDASGQPLATNPLGNVLHLAAQERREIQVLVPTGPTTRQATAAHAETSLVRWAQ